MRVAKVVSMLMCVILLTALLPGEVFAAPNTSSPYYLGWDLVDSGLHCDWGGSTKYSAQWNNAVSIWNSMGVVSIRKDTMFTVQDVELYDYYEVSSVTAVTYSSGKIGFNTYNLDNCTSDEITNTAAHELGHALGIKHLSAGNIMYPYQTSQTWLGNGDRTAYNDIWK
ncbi:MAG: hypothetical protein PWR01_1059 [Clostridiales bacterium]|nr:hypothetical protein [Clostridiales bacterium]